ncbi:hypothetical protein BZL29_1361 [Mycobacterium kansasii]|uniref:Uncharacterized protein n=1 Tax=Mycobacterium kansasii TaxID=1768 RepID=A0A1V3XVR5_MYCKA|nr:hypothetical protein BZL29_1361 [Mycobacterium kansasii]
MPPGHIHHMLMLVGYRLRAHLTSLAGGFGAGWLVLIRARTS